MVSYCINSFINDYIPNSMSMLISIYAPTIENNNIKNRNGLPGQKCCRLQWVSTGPPRVTLLALSHFRIPVTI